MSKERAKRRAEREAAGAAGGTGPARERAEATLAARPGEQARAVQRPAPARPRPKSTAEQSWWQRLFRPRHHRRRFSRRTRSQRVTIVFVVAAVLGLIWLLADDWGVRIGLSLVAVFATPAFVTMALGRSHR